MATDYYLRADLDDPLPQPVAHTHWGGIETGCVVRMLRPLPDDQVIVSEYGDEMTVAELRAKDGQGRRELG